MLNPYRSIFYEQHANFLMQVNDQSAKNFV